MKQTQLKKSLTALSLAAGLMVGSGAVVAAAELIPTSAAPELSAQASVSNGVMTDCDPSQIREYVPEPYKVNEYGQTYGSDLGADEIEDIPDLIRVIGDHGVLGYVTREDMIGTPPGSPEEAIRIQRERELTGEKEIINVYDVDGRTVIDTFTFGDRG